MPPPSVAHAQNIVQSIGGLEHIKGGVKLGCIVSTTGGLEYVYLIFTSDLRNGDIDMHGVLI